MKKLTLTFIAVLTATFSFAQSEWALDAAHSNIGFTVSHMVISETEGEFKDFTASITSKTNDFNGAEVEFFAKVNSIDTDNKDRDNHLKSEDFFNAEKYPEIKFKGKLVKKGSKYELDGTFTMKDVTKKVTFPVTYAGTVLDPYGNTKAGFKIKGTVNRQDYGLKWSALTEAGNLVVGNEVNITCSVELQKQG